MGKKYLVRIRSDFMRWFENTGAAPHAVIEADDEAEAERKFRESIPIVVEEVVLDEPNPPKPREVAGHEGDQG
ncbi:MAG: hypothetical protein DRO39_02510 [Thermoprotei archaeon]|nr:MAG: hypothetical protein DRO39_02510 [Thermoprotei archaeon]